MRDTQHIPERIAVIGAGMVGVSVALALQRRGSQVTLIDRRAPGSETSYGNAGVLARSSLMPLNNPGLWRTLPKLLGNRQTSFRYSPGYLAKNWRWLYGFLSSARTGPTMSTVAALDGLIQLSLPLHKDNLTECGQLDLLCEKGWMFLYRSEAGYAGSRRLRQALGQFEIRHAVLDRNELSDEMPTLNPLFARALWIKDTASVRDPGKAVAGLAELFVRSGGHLERADVDCPSFSEGTWTVLPSEGPFDKLVICAGPWSRVLMERMGYHVPMVTERGYHAHFGGEAATNAKLDRPIYDTSGGYVLSPMAKVLRLSTGVELADLDASSSHAQINAAEVQARQAIDLGQRLDETPWKGARPTLPDSRPAIGAVPEAQGLYAGFGHQHIGFSTGPGTGALLASLMNGEQPPLDCGPFDPARFIRRVRPA